MGSIYQQLLEKLTSKSDYQLGTLLTVNGSAPQIAGAMALFNKNQVILGTLGGGLLEANAQKMAKIANQNQQNIIQSITFNAEVDDEQGAICGGRAKYFIDVNPKKHIAVYQQLTASINQLQSGVLISLITKTEQEITVNKHWIENKQVLPKELESYLSNSINIKKIISERKPVWVENLYNDHNSVTEISLFIEPIFPKSQLVIVGAGHIGQALCKVASFADFDVVILDHRVELMNHQRFPDASKLIIESIENGFKNLNVSTNSYVVITTQGHRTDIEALRCCIQSDAAYIGIIGSIRKAKLLRMKFLKEDWANEDEIHFIQSPIGIDIHSKTVNEIAISIVAQLIQKRHEIHFLAKQKKVSAVILAAGKSTRMGKQKLLMPYENTSIIRSIVTKSLNSNLNQTIVVIGSHKNEVIEELNSLNIDLIENGRFEEGMLSSIQTGIKAVDEESDGVMILLGDQPMVSINIINRLIATFQKSNKGVIIPTFNNKRGHPVLISKKYWKQIKDLNPAIGLRELMMNNTHDMLEIKMENDVILKDIDTPEDYELATYNNIT